jgi:TetR/AcrR family transcriptional regulator
MRGDDTMNAITEPQAKSRKEEILNVATALFAERGYDGTSMNDVAERVGMRKASLFYHFATKDTLYEAVLNRLFDVLGTPLDAVYSAEGSFAARVETVAETATALLCQYPFASRLMLREFMDWGPVVREKLSSRILAILESAVAFVRLGQEAGEFTPGDAKQLVLSCIGLHMLPFAASQLVRSFMGADVFDPRFVAERRAAVRVQIRDMFVRR